ncbi:hypothetical protein SDC9_179392 [bioreactor metagenome]|uniref:Uncharacterized protein n=1 Tax=bioreactor metagenome TaxID=1076179 RepID=A0A645GYT1_9ZZZZ
MPLDLDVDRGASGDEDVRGHLFGHELEQLVENHRDELHLREDEAGPRPRIGAVEDQARSRSLIAVLARVWASTFLTMTAQYRLYLPSAEGRLPGTTTEPAGTRP